MSTTTTNRDAGQSSTTAAARYGLMGLLLVQLFIGYEWFVSGLTKMVRGGFPSGLADELTEKSEGAAGWYTSFLDEIVIPNGTAFGYLIEIGELLVGVALVAAALLWLVGWARLSQRGRTAVLLVTALAALAGILMNVNFHLANGSAHPWLIPEEGFDEGVDLDSLMPAIQAVLLFVSVAVLRAIRREQRASVSSGATALQSPA